MNKEQLEELLVVGAIVELGEEYCKDSHTFSSGQEITLIQGYFEQDNGLYTEEVTAPSIKHEYKGYVDYDSIYHLFGNNLEDFADCKIISSPAKDKV